MGDEQKRRELAQDTHGQWIDKDNTQKMIYHLFIPAEL